MVDLLCIDIDGTLLDSRKELPRENVEAVRYALDKGVIVAIASGRSVSGIAAFTAGDWQVWGLPERRSGAVRGGYLQGYHGGRPGHENH